MTEKEFLEKIDKGELSLFNEKGELSSEIAKKLVDFEKAIKQVKEMEDRLKESILSQMEDKGIIKWNNEDISITYVAPTYKESFDSKALRAEDEALYNKYIKLSQVKSSIRIKLK